MYFISTFTVQPLLVTVFDLDCALTVHLCALNNDYFEHLKEEREQENERKFKELYHQ